MCVKPALVLLAVLLAQVPWLPCHCLATCTAVPALGPVEAGGGAQAHEGCPVHGLKPGAPLESHDEGRPSDHEHTLTWLVAVRADVPASAQAPAAVVVPGASAARPGPCSWADEPTAPACSAFLARLTTVRLLH